MDTHAEPERSRRPLIHRFSAAVLWNLVATVFNQGSTFAANIALANILGRALFGRYAIVLSTVQAVSALAALGMGYAATKYIAELRVRDRDRAARILGFASATAHAAAILVTLAMWLAAPRLAAGYLEAPDIAVALRVGCIGIAWIALNGYLTGVLAGLEEYRALAIAGTIAGTTYLTLCVGGAWLWGIEGAVSGVVASAAIQWCILSFSTRRALARHELKPDYRRLGEERAIVRRWVVPGLLSGLTAIPALWLAQSFLARTPDGFSEVAAYAASFNLMTIVLFLPNVANTVGMSLINHSLGRGDGADYRRVFWMNLQFSAGIVVLGALAIAGGGPFILRAYGASFASAYPVLLILLLATLPESATIALTQVLQSKEKVWLAIGAVNVPRDSLLVMAAWFLVPELGARGLALAYLSGRLVGLITTFLCVRRVGLALVPDPVSIPAAAST